MIEKLNTIGNTQLIKINYEYNGKEKYIYAKLEYYNLTGSIKDRVAYYIIKNAYKRRELIENKPIIEATSGNTGISISALGALYKNPVYIFMPDWASEERIKLMENYGAKVILFSKEEGGFIRCIEEAKKIAIEKDGFLANQFSNIDNFIAHYETTGEEIIKQLPEEVSAFISGVGTGGTLMGVGKRLKKEYENLKIVALEPEKMALLSGKEIKEHHKIEGIGDDFIPELVDKKVIDEIILVNDEDAINMSRLLAKKLGLGVGISSGANFIASVLMNDKLEKPVITVFADDNKKYLSTELSKDLDENLGFISNKIILKSFNI